MGVVSEKSAASAAIPCVGVLARRRMGSSGDHRAGTFSWQVIRVYTEGKSGSQNGNPGQDPEAS